MLLELSSNKDIFIKLLKLFGLLDLLNLSMTSKGLCEFITKTNELWVRHIFTFIIDNGLEIKAVGDVNRLDIMAFTLNNLLRLNFLTEQNKKLKSKIEEMSSKKELDSTKQKNIQVRTQYNVAPWPLTISSSNLSSHYPNFFQNIKGKVNKKMYQATVEENKAKIDKIMSSFYLSPSQESVTKFTTPI